MVQPAGLDDAHLDLAIENRRTGRKRSEAVRLQDEGATFLDIFQCRRLVQALEVRRGRTLAWPHIEARAGEERLEAAHAGESDFWMHNPELRALVRDRRGILVQPQLHPHAAAIP